MTKKHFVFIFGVLPLISQAAHAEPSFLEIRAQFQKGFAPQPSVPGHDDLRTYESWSCSSAYYDPQKAGFTSNNLFNFRTCLENNGCYYNNQAQHLPSWFPAWFGFENNGELDSDNGQFVTDRPISSCSGDILACALKKKGDHVNMMFVRKNENGALLLEWTTKDNDSNLAYASFAAPDQKAVLYSICALEPGR